MIKASFILFRLFDAFGALKNEYSLDFLVLLYQDKRTITKTWCRRQAVKDKVARQSRLKSKQHQIKSKSKCQLNIFYKLGKEPTALLRLLFAGTILSPALCWYFLKEIAPNRYPPSQLKSLQQFPLRPRKASNQLLLLRGCFTYVFGIYYRSSFR